MYGSIDFPALEYLFWDALRDIPRFRGLVSTQTFVYISDGGQMSCYGMPWTDEEPAWHFREIGVLNTKLMKENEYNYFNQLLVHEKYTQVILRISDILTVIQLVVI